MIGQQLWQAAVLKGGPDHNHNVPVMPGGPRRIRQPPKCLTVVQTPAAGLLIQIKMTVLRAGSAEYGPSFQVLCAYVTRRGEGGS